MLLSEKEKETLIRIANVFRERAIEKYVIHDETYKNLIGIAETAEKKFLKQAPSEDMKDQINQIWERRSAAEEYKETLLYVLGMLRGITFLRSIGLLDMIFEEDEPIDNDKKECYLVATIPGQEGCIAMHTQYGKRLSSFVEKWKEKGVELFVISRPEDYAEYEPYRFVSTIHDFLDKIMPLIVQDMSDDSLKKEE